MARKTEPDVMRDADIAALESEASEPRLDGYISRQVQFPPYSPGVDGETGNDPIILKIAVANTLHNRRLLADMQGSRVEIVLRGFDQMEIGDADAEGSL